MYPKYSKAFWDTFGISLDVYKRQDYDSPEDLYEDNPWDYEDEDEAWDEWEND